MDDVLLGFEPSNGGNRLQRWIFGPDGEATLLDIPLTPEDFLNPQLEDKMTQGNPHARLMRNLAVVLDIYFENREDVVILMDVKHCWGIPGLSEPSPDVSVVQGVRREDLADWESFDAVAAGTVPSLILELASSSSSRLWKSDHKDKVELYEKVGIPEYIIVDLPRRGTQYRYRLTGYRQAVGGRYVPMEPDAEGRLVSQTTGLAFAISPEGDAVLAFDAATGRRLLLPLEEAAGRQAEAKARRAAEARAASAEAENARLRAELDRLKRGEG